MLKLTTIVISLVLSVLNVVGLPQSTDSYSLSTYCYEGSAPIEGVDVLLYKVGTFSDKIVWDDKYIGISNPDLSSVKSIQACANSILSRIQGSGYNSDYSIISNNKGQVQFNDLDPGVYCIISKSKIVGNTIYTVVPTLVILDSDKSIELKATVSNINPSSPSKTIDVKKEWVLSGKAKATPVKVALLRNNIIADSVELNADNNWSYSWSNLDSSSVWSVSEISVPEGFVAELSESNNSFTITNVAIYVFKAKPPTGIGSKSYMGYIVGNALLFLLTVGIIVLVKKKETKQ